MLPIAYYYSVVVSAVRAIVVIVIVVMLTNTAQWTSNSKPSTMLCFTLVLIILVLISRDFSLYLVGSSVNLGLITRHYLFF